MNTALKPPTSLQEMWQRLLLILNITGGFVCKKQVEDLLSVSFSKTEKDGKRLRFGGACRHTFKSGSIFLLFFLAMLSQSIFATPVCEEMMGRNYEEKITDLTPVETPKEFLELLRKIHENFMLLDDSFYEDKNISRLFKSGELKDLGQANSSGEVWKELLSSDNSALPGNIRYGISIVGSSFLGWIFASNFNEKSSFPVELAEKYLVPGVNGYDPLTPDLPTTNEKIEYAAKRKPKTHVRGYFLYIDDLDGRCGKSRLIVRIDGGGKILDIELEQSKKKGETK